MKKYGKRLAVCIILAVFMALTLAVSASATVDVAETTAVVAEESGDGVITSKAIAAAATICVVATAAAIAMGFVIAKSSEGISRQPEADGKIRTAMMLGLVFIETVVIYALIVAILIIFVL